LIINGDAEAAAGSPDGNPVATPSWTVGGEATALQYGASGGYPQATDPGPANRGNNLFAGGANDATSTLTQTISLSAYLGGFEGQEDNAVLSVSFQNGTTEVGTGHVGPVTAADRGSVTGLLARTATGAVPAGTRSAVVTLTATRLEGTANDGYADNLSLALTGI
jgi:hypothetical protein